MCVPGTSGTDYTLDCGDTGMPTICKLTEGCPQASLINNQQIGFSSQFGLEVSLLIYLEATFNQVTTTWDI